ncbi:MAG TPA: Gfo/Idh/MocA family oxidoreductase [Anaerolineae bacterium]|nr:Gfo/Idh/MocA family oxidoreductase [Anaerolineae bacterium]
MGRESLGFAIIGCGFISTQHAWAIKECRGGELRVACDIDPSRAEALASRYGAEATTNFDAVLRREDVDVVNICTLPVLHAEMAIKAAQAGKHVLVEKPIAPTLEEADQMIASCRQAGVKLAVIHQMRFSTINRRMKELLDAGAIGKPFFIDVTYRTFRPQAYFDRNERGTGRLDGGGAFITHAIHDLDVILMFMGPVRSVMARKAVLGHVMEVEDMGVALFEFENGAMGILSAGTCIKRHHDRTVEIHGPEGTLFHNEKVLEHYITRGQPITYEEIGLDAPGTLHKVQIRDLIEAIREDREPVINGEVARRPLELVQAIYESCETDRLVYLEGRGKV